MAMTYTQLEAKTRRDTFNHVIARHLARLGGPRWDEDLTVTPEIAAHWLENLSTRQAPMKRALVVRYSTMRLAGVWDEANEEPIKIDTDGKLINGKHRLQMVVETGMPTQFHVHHNVPSGVYNTTDTGRLRGLDDVGYERFHGNKKAAAIAKAMISTADPSSNAIRLAANLPLMREFQEAYQEAIAFTCEQFKTAMRGITAPVQAAVAHAYYHVPPYELVLFVDRLYSGIVADESECAVIKLRDWLTAHNCRSARPALSGNAPRIEVYLKAARTIQLFVARTPTRCVRAATVDPFPLPGFKELARARA